MQTQTPFNYGGKSFETLSAIKRHIQEAIDYKNRVIGKEFFDDVLADVVVDRHYRWRHKKVRPTSFQFMANDKGKGRTWGDSLAGFFPGLGWNRFSYQKALRSTPITLESEFRRLCRERWSRLWKMKYNKPGMRCSVSGCYMYASDVDHIEPQHKEIVAQCWALVDEATAVTWWELLIEQPMDSHFVLPDAHPVTALYDKLTEGGTYLAVCKEHHREATRQRRKKPLVRQ